MKTNFVKISFGLFLITLLLLLATYSCSPIKNEQPDNITDNANITVFLTDDPALHLEKVFLHILKLEVKIEDSGTLNQGGWINLRITPGIFDVLRFRNGMDTLLAFGNIPVNLALKKMRMTLGNNNSILYQGNSYPLEIKDNDNEIVANLDASNVDFLPPNQYSFFIDFDVQHSIQKKSNNRFELKSKIKIFSKHTTGIIEGKVLPTIANAVIFAVKGTDTSSAIPDHNGSYKIRGLNPGLYKLIVDATSNNYRDTVLQSIIVHPNFSTKLNTINLQQ